MNKPLSPLLWKRKIVALPTDILSLTDKDKFQNSHLPLFACPACAREWHDPHGNGSMINLMGSPCVSCGYSIDIKEFQALSLKQFQKQDYAFHLDIDSPKHQEIIQRFQKNVLWECDQCKKHNLNLPKNAQGEPDAWANVQCEGCGHPYKHEVDLLPFWALKGIGYDDGDDTTNVYELKMLGELQLLWLQALAKAKKIDAHAGTQSFDERKKLIVALENIKSRSRWISGGRWKDGSEALRFIEEYLVWKTTAISHQVQRDISWYARAVLETNNPNRKTPYKNDANFFQQYLYNLQHFEATSIFLTLLALGCSVGVALAVLEKEISFEIESVYHTARVEREDKGTLNLEYAFYRDEPYYDNGIEYRRIIDRTGLERYEAYAEEREFYRLREIWWVQTRNNGHETLDTGINEWVSTICPDTSSPSSWGGWLSPSGGSRGMWSWGSGDLFHRPEGPFIPWIPLDNITSLSPITQEYSFSLLDIIASPAYAGSCGYYRDITVRAEKRITVQEYQVWDWKTQTWFSSPRTEWTDTVQTFVTLEWRILNDSENQQIIGRDTLLEAEIRKDGEDSESISIPDEAQWYILSENIGAQCTLSKSYLLWILQGIDAEDITEQCKF